MYYLAKWTNAASKEGSGPGTMGQRSTPFPDFVSAPTHESGSSVGHATADSGQECRTVPVAVGAAKIVTMPVA